MRENVRKAVARLATVVLSALVALLACLAAFPSTARAADTAPAIKEAQSAIVVDEDGNVLWSLNPDAEIPMASITKVMTAVVALDSGRDLDAPCTITKVDLGPNSQTAGFEPTDTPTLRELLQAMLVFSGNDAAYNVALNVAGSEEAFVALMNAKAAELGMTHTRFANPHGLEPEGDNAPGHYSSVADLVTLGRYARENYPLIASTVILPEVTLQIDGMAKTLPSTDALMGSYQGIMGIKTGAVEAGTAFLGCARRHGVTLYTCVLGCKTVDGRFADTVALLDWAYSDAFGYHQAGSNAWEVDVTPCPDNFLMSCVTHVVGATAVPYERGAGDLSYSATRIPDSDLPLPKEQVADVTWSQGDKRVGRLLYVASLDPRPVTSMNIFALPLMAA